ncbi:Palmitoyl-protein_thioesterase [Hexamita inflata]|uniref:Palmitoyl-protein thioesterase n=1 Tax=Hexamita inflata TaxID=28002 RepID=A0AA86NNT5_9EUKA|nr:Palmitoyl-protein thioesterase [Hexamita inflata]
MMTILQVSLFSCQTATDDDTIIVLVHGFSANYQFMNPLKYLMQQTWPNRKVVNLKILLNGFSSVFENPERYLRAAAEEIREKTSGYNCIDIIGHSQGGFVSRSYLQLYSGAHGYPGVRNIVGIAAVFGGYFRPISIVEKIISYKHSSLIVPTGYWKSPYRTQTYSKSDSIICKLNGECGEPIPGLDKIQQLKSFTCLYSHQDEVLSPPSTSRFDFYAQNSTTLQKIEDQQLQLDLGLKQLFDQNKFHTFEFTDYKHNEFVQKNVGDVFFGCLKGVFEGDFSCSGRT